MSDLDFNILQTPRQFLDDDISDEIEHEKDTIRHTEENKDTVTTIEHVRYVKREQEHNPDGDHKVDF